MFARGVSGGHVDRQFEREAARGHAAQQIQPLLVR
jgi:hypothetical protein